MREISTVKRVAFSNFRRFKKFPSMNLGGINILVGTNNSGKSTFIKAVILMLKNLTGHSDYSDIPISKFSFASDFDSHMHLGDFSSNLHQGSEPESMEFEIEIGDTTLKYRLDGAANSNAVPSLSVPVKNLQIKNRNFSCWVEYDFESDTRCIESFYFSEDEVDSILKPLNSKCLKIQSILENRHNSIDEKRVSYFKKEYDLLTSEIHKISEGPSLLIRGRENDERFYGIQRDLHSDMSSRSILLPIGGFMDNDEWVPLTKLRDSIAKDLMKYAILYIDTHSASHNEILFTEDKNNYLAQTVLQYLDKCDSDNYHHKDFITKWLKIFNIGEDFRIVRLNSEAFTVEILSKGIWRSLGMMGTGAIQLFILLLRSTIAFDRRRVALFVEEPEQNLHPALQSKLADLFYEIHTSSQGRIQLFVETHSEYLVRKLQVIVADLIRSREKNSVEMNNEIKVYYFPSSSESGTHNNSEMQQPYSMNFRYDGHFEEKFGSGFFDVASGSYLALLK